MWGKTRNLSIMCELANKGMGIIMISSDLPEFRNVGSNFSDV